MNPNEDKLALINDRLGFLERDYQFSLREASPTIYYLESENCRIPIVFEMWKVHMSIGPIGPALSSLLKNGVRGGHVNIKIVSRCLDSGYSFEPLPWDARIDIPKEFDVYANLLRKYCKRMLEGDFSQWSAIRQCIRRS